MIKAIIFDLDGTLLKLNEELFIKNYFGLISKYMSNYGYDGEKLIKNIYTGTKLMRNNDGTKTCEEVFWDNFTNEFGKEKIADKSIFETFYKTEFKKLSTCYEPNPLARTTVDFCKANNLKVILATSPFFPVSGINGRLEYLSLSDKNFDYITSYENSSYSKSNPNYYAQILEKNNLSPNEVLFFGNSAEEDADNSAVAGIKTFLISETYSGSPEKKDNYNLVSFENIIETISRELGL